MTEPYILQHGRRFAHIHPETKTVSLLIQDNKRKPPRPCRSGTKTLITEAECWCAAALWLRKGAIDFGDRVH